MLSDSEDRLTFICLYFASSYAIYKYGPQVGIIMLYLGYFAIAAWFVFGFCPIIYELIRRRFTSK